MSRGTAMSTMKIGLCRRCFSARSTAPLPRIGSWLAVELMTMSLLTSSWGMSASSTAWAPNSSARMLARSRVRLATTMRFTPCSCRWRATRVMVSPAPISSAWLRVRSAKICRARLTAAKATDTGFSPMAVSVRMVLAVLKVAWNSRPSIGPTVPASRATA
ncbi:hypothetical protein D9M70_366740 [compost metagenome]